MDPSADDDVEFEANGSGPVSSQVVKSESYANNGVNLAFRSGIVPTVVVAGNVVASYFEVEKVQMESDGDTNYIGANTSIGTLVGGSGTDIFQTQRTGMHPTGFESKVLAR